MHTFGEVLSLAGLIAWHSADTAIQRDLDREYNAKAVEDAAKAEEEAKGEVLDAEAAKTEEVSK